MESEGKYSHCNSIEGSLSDPVKLQPILLPGTRQRLVYSRGERNDLQPILTVEY